MLKELGQRGRAKLWLRSHARAEVDAARAIRDTLATAGARVIDGLHRMDHVTPGGVADLLPADLGRRVAAAAGPHLRLAALQGGKDEWHVLTARRRRTPQGVRWKADIPVPPEVQDGILQFVTGLLDEPYWTDLGEGLRDDVAAAVLFGLNDGETTAEIARRLREILGADAAAGRAMLIARTEATGALNAGAAAARDHVVAVTGLPLLVEWSTIADNRRRDDHAAAHGQTIRQGGEFTVGGERCSYPGDARLSAKQRCRCRCAAISKITPPGDPRHPDDVPGVDVGGRSCRVRRKWLGTNVLPRSVR